MDALKAVHKAFPLGLSNTAIMEGWLDVLVGQALEHEANHAEIDPRLTGRLEEFIVAAHPAAA